MLRKALCLVALSLLVALPACSKEETPQKISLNKKEKIAAPKSAGNGSIRFAVGGMITPKQGLAYYKDFLDYISGKLGQPVTFVDRDDYAEINNLLENGKLDLAFVCSGPYVDGREKFGLELLVMPSAFGGTFYHSYIIVGSQSPIDVFEKLRGKKFAFTDPLSNSGKLAPTYMLARMGETPESFFHDYVYAKSHDNAIKAVAQGLVDGAAVDSLIWEYLDRTNSEFTSKTKIVKKSPPYGIPPVVVAKAMEPGQKERLRRIFLNADSDKKGREILGRMMIDKFVAPDDRAYDTVREMKTFLRQADSK